MPIAWRLLSCRLVASRLKGLRSQVLGEPDPEERMSPFKWFSLAGCAAIGWLGSMPAQANPPPLNQVRSFEYAIAASDSYPSDIYQLIASSPSDLVILGGGNYTTPLNRSLADPAGNKLVVSYIDVGEAAPFWYPQLFA